MHLHLWEIWWNFLNKVENKFITLFNSNLERLNFFNNKLYNGERLDDKESQELSFISKVLPELEKYKRIQEDIDYAKLSNLFDKETINDLNQALEEKGQFLEKLIAELSKEEVDEFIVEMRAGAGGEEAALFVKDLFGAYSRFLTNKRYSFEIIEMTEAESGGYSTLILEVKSPQAYEILKNEGGVHRVQRVPKTESSGRIHTSTISIAILPIYKKTDVEINSNDLIIDVYRSSGHGGQSVNTTDSAVRITHKPSGLVVTCQNTKSQIKNKEMALKVLKARLEEIERNSKTRNLQEIRNKQILGSERAEKIRTYNYLQDRITDHRAKLDFSNIPKFMQGEIEDILIEINKKIVLENQN